ncbi:hypothetical protein ScPMuIL_018958 [Solemya velum]
MALSLATAPNVDKNAGETADLLRQLSGQDVHIDEDLCADLGSTFIFRGATSPLSRTDSDHNRSLSIQSQRSWIERTFYRRECCKFIRSPRDHTKCCCGRDENWHLTKLADAPTERWHPYRHTEARLTDAYGTIEFQGAPHPSKAQYVRLSSFDTKPEHVLTLLQKHWGLDLPKLLITVHGGILNFDLQPKLKRVFRKGLLKAAKTTGAWIITSGTNTGVTRHVGDAISDRTMKAKNKIVAIGIAPWGIVENKNDLVGKDIVVPYHCVSSPKTNYAVLNSNHSYFLLVDNGTFGKYGGEIMFRKKLERYIAQQKICITSGVKGRGVPVICVVLEGGANTIRSVLEYVTDAPPVPVVVCDGSGRAADLLAFTHKYTLDDGTMPESLRDQLIITIQKTFQYSMEQAEKLFIELMLCVKKKELITVFRMAEGAQDIDLAILTALLKGTNANAPDQLSLVLTWDRVDIARSHIFVYGQEWPEGSLEQAMMDALINDRVDFVKLLLENGVSMQTFLTIPRLEELYNTREGPSNTLRYLVRDIKKHAPSNYQYTLPDIGLVIQHLMGGAFRATYCRKRFRQKYVALKRNGTSLGNVVTAIPMIMDTKLVEELFPYPFHDLMIWAVLMKRQKMALFMWQHGEEAMAKALMACKLYKAMAHEADQDDLEVDISDELRAYAKEFQDLSIDLLEHCYKSDDDYTQQLLTYELKNFSEQTCLSLAVTANHREFIAHSCCQILLNDMWMGGLRMRKSTSLKVILGIFMPPYIMALEFKSKEELQLMPQTMEEHLEQLEDNDSEKDDISMSSFDIDQVIENDFGQDEMECSFNSGTPVAVKENGNIPTDTISYFNPVHKKKKSPLRLGKKIYEFYNAPITKFWAHTMAYIAFLMFYTYVVLIKTSKSPRWQEYYVMSYIFSLAVEKIRQVIASEPVKFKMKLHVFFGELWNIWETIAIVIFVVGFSLRHTESTLQTARLIFIVNIVFWYIRILEILSVNKYLGPYVKIIGKLIRDMSYFIIILLIILMSFGVVRQSVHFQNEEPSWHLVRNVFFYPYWMIYGELFADEIDTCDSEEGCVYGSWVAPALMCMYLLVANILLVNLLIARFNATFIRNNAMSREIWKYQRYQLIINYELRPILPPPLIVWSHVYLALRDIIRRCKRKRDFYDNGLKLFLSHQDTEKLHDFEEECVEDCFHEKELKFQSSADERIRVIHERVENMTMRMDDVNTKENSIKLSLQTVDYRLSKLEDLASQTTDMLSILQNFVLNQGSGSRSRNLSASTDRTIEPLQSQESLVEQSDLTNFDDGGGYVSKRDSLGVSKKDNLKDAKPIHTPKPSSDAGEQAVTSMKETMRNLPSPLLVHSKKPIRDDYLKKFTDYTKPVSPRVGADFPKTPVLRSSGSRKPERQLSQKSRHSLPELQETSPEITQSPFPFSDTETKETNSEKSLLERRHGAPKLSINIKTTNVSVSSSDESKPVCGLEEGAQDVNHSAVVYSIAKIESETQVCTGVPEKGNFIIPGGAGLTNATSSIVITPVSPQAVSPARMLMRSSAVYGSMDNNNLLPSSVISQLTPILTSLSAEYTTITDDIDTSVVMDRSPPRSPATAGVFFSDSFFCPGRKRESEASRSEKEVLKQAEEMEHRRMGKVIRNRLRQISQDESDSISDIARLVVCEMTANPPDQSEQEDEDEEDQSSQSIEPDQPSVVYEPVRIRIRRPSQDTESLKMLQLHFGQDE